MSGAGAWAACSAPCDTRLARTVALKVLAPDQAADRDTLLRFQNEAQSAARLDHDNIARVYYVGEDRGLHYIVFEFIAGVNIRELVEAKGPLPLAEAISYTLQAAEALAHAASRNVVHRDIKPSNLLITPGRAGETHRHGAGAAAGTQQRGGGPDRQRDHAGDVRLHLARAGPRPPKRRRPQRPVLAGMHVSFTC